MKVAVFSTEAYDREFLTVANADNAQTGPGANWSFSNLVGGDNVLSSNELSGPRTLKCNNPNNEQPRFLGNNVVPRFAVTAVLGNVAVPVRCMSQDTDLPLTRGEAPPAPLKRPLDKLHREWNALNRAQAADYAATLRGALSGSFLCRRVLMYSECGPQLPTRTSKGLPRERKPLGVLMEGKLI